MKTIQELQQQIEQGILHTTYPSYPEALYQPINYIMSLGGKRMRPALLLMSCDLFDGNLEEAIEPALAIEVFHNFTLVHDDIMDNAPLRRGKQTVHEKWNPSVAILSGDVMLVEAYKLMSKVAAEVLAEVLDIFSATAVGVCEGQQIDMSFEAREDVTIAEYTNMIRLKTAVLLAGALKIGALIAGATKQDANLIYSFGEHLGVAFQLQDDLLDVYGDPDKFGKQVGGDIIANKKTFLLIQARKLATGAAEEKLEQWLVQEQFDATEKVQAITQVYNDLNIKQLTEQAIHEHAQIAISALNEIDVEDERKVILKAFAQQLLEREY